MEYTYQNASGERGWGEGAPWGALERTDGASEEQGACERVSGYGKEGEERGRSKTLDGVRSRRGLVREEGLGQVGPRRRSD